MCLRYKLTTEDKDKWLKSKPKLMTAYKVVKVGRNVTRGVDEEALWPPIFDMRPYKRVNRISDDIKATPVITATFGRNKKTPRHPEYRAGYHLFLTREGAKHWTTLRGVHYEAIIKCRVLKKDILAVGRQCFHTVIVTKEFAIVGEDKYFLDHETSIKEEQLCV